MDLFLWLPSISYIWHHASSNQQLRKTFRKTNISDPLIRTRKWVYQGVKNVGFSENFAYLGEENGIEEFHGGESKNPCKTKLL